MASNLKIKKRDIEAKKTTKRTPKAIIKKEAVQTPIVTKAATSSYAKDTDEEIDTAEIAQEDWIEYTQRSTAEAEEN